MSISLSGRYNFVAKDPNTLTDTPGTTSSIFLLILNMIWRVLFESFKPIPMTFFRWLHIIVEVYNLVVESQKAIFNLKSRNCKPWGDIFLTNLLPCILFFIDNESYHPNIIFFIDQFHRLLFWQFFFLFSCLLVVSMWFMIMSCWFCFIVVTFWPFSSAFFSRVVVITMYLFARPWLFDLNFWRTFDDLDWSFTPLFFAAFMVIIVVFHDNNIIHFKLFWQYQAYGKWREEISKKFRLSLFLLTDNQGNIPQFIHDGLIVTFVQMLLFIGL